MGSMNFKKIYQDNKSIVWAAVLGIIITVGILFKVQDEITRFTLIMPVFAGFILFSILVTADEELEEENGIDGESPRKKKSARK